MIGGRVYEGMPGRSKSSSVANGTCEGGKGHIFRHAGHARPLTGGVSSAPLHLVLYLPCGGGLGLNSQVGQTAREERRTRTRRRT